MLARRNDRTPRNPRRGTVAIELLLTMPVVLILALAFVEYSLILISESKLNLAACAGANAARHGGSEQDVDDAVTACLPGRNYVQNRKVKIIWLHAPSDHRRGTAAEFVWERTAAPSQNAIENVIDDCGQTARLADLPPLSAIQVRVEVPANRVIPNMLKHIGFDLAGETLSGAAVMAKE